MGVLSGMIAGAFGGFIGINLLAWVAKRNSRPHDLTSFTSDHNVIARIEDWAQAHGYRLVANNAGTRLYRKGRSILTAPMFLEVSQQGRRYVCRSYTRINGLLVKADIALSGNSFIAKLPRSMAKKAQNELFASLNVPGLP
ncbi:hypothetical protein [Stenotrophomonas sp.]|uniref:hypothetical protein n=1 Tax=Stenotrophomonas sp. TaxID=69392 RepID=UPI0028ACB57E|nr:hypothetical protein [Stenotrophomonas sp.]